MLSLARAFGEAIRRSGGTTLPLAVLSVSSTPVSVTVSYSGTVSGRASTPFTLYGVDRDLTVTLNAPSSVTVGGKTYALVKWSTSDAGEPRWHKSLPRVTAGHKTLLVPSAGTLCLISGCLAVARIGNENSLINITNIRYEFLR